jgi:nitrogen fixation protein NifX
MLRVAFASNDRSTVNQHFGAAEGFAIYALDGERAQLVEIVEFPPESMDGNEGKLPAQIAMLAGCAAVYCLAAGASAVKQLLAAGVQPIRLDDETEIDGLLQQISLAICAGGIAWVDKAIRRQEGSTRASIACLKKAGTNDGVLCKLAAGWSACMATWPRYASPPNRAAMLAGHAPSAAAAAPLRVAALAEWRSATPCCSNWIRRTFPSPWRLPAAGRDAAARHGAVFLRWRRRRRPRCRRLTTGLFLVRAAWPAARRPSARPPPSSVHPSHFPEKAHDCRSCPASAIEPADDPIYATDFVREMLRQTRALDSYGQWDGKPVPAILAGYVLSKEQKRAMPTIGDPDE